MPSTEPVSNINYKLLLPHSVLYWPSTQLHHLVTHSWANWIEFSLHFRFLRDSHLETVKNDKRGWHFAIKLSTKVRTWEANISLILLLKSLVQYKEITWWLCFCWLWWWRRWRWLYLPSCVCTAKAPGGSPEKLRSGAAAIFQNSHNDPFSKRSISGERAS